MFNIFRLEPPMILSRRSLFIYTSAAMLNPTQSWLCWLLTQCEKTPKTAVQWSEVLPWGACALWGTNFRFSLLLSIGNGKSILKISKWPSVRTLSLKNEILWWADGNSCRTARPLQQYFPYNSFNFLKNSNCRINLHFNARGLKIGHSQLVFLMCSFHFWHSLSYCT